jgi:hypothetical protein
VVVAVVIIGLILIPMLSIDSWTGTIGLDPDLTIDPATPGLPPLTRLPGRPAIEETEECGEEAFDRFAPGIEAFPRPAAEALLLDPADDFLVVGGVPFMLPPNAPPGE